MSPHTLTMVETIITTLKRLFEAYSRQFPACLTSLHMRRLRHQAMYRASGDLYHMHRGFHGDILPDADCGAATGAVTEVPLWALAEVWIDRKTDTPTSMPNLLHVGPNDVYEFFASLHTVGLGFGVKYVSAQMVLHYFCGQSVHSSACRGELAQNLAAGLLCLKRSFDALDLAFQATNSSNQLLFVADGVGHGRG